MQIRHWRRRGTGWRSSSSSAQANGRGWPTRRPWSAAALTLTLRRRMTFRSVLWCLSGSVRTGQSGSPSSSTTARTVFSDHDHPVPRFASRPEHRRSRPARALSVPGHKDHQLRSTAAGSPPRTPRSRTRIRRRVAQLPQGGHRLRTQPLPSRSLDGATFKDLTPEFGRRDPTRRRESAGARQRRAVTVVAVLVRGQTLRSARLRARKPTTAAATA